MFCLFFADHSSSLLQLRGEHLQACEGQTHGGHCQERDEISEKEWHQVQDHVSSHHQNWPPNHHGAKRVQQDPETNADCPSTFKKTRSGFLSSSHECCCADLEEDFSETSHFLDLSFLFRVSFPGIIMAFLDVGSSFLFFSLIQIKKKEKGRRHVHSQRAKAKAVASLSPS